VAPAIVQTAVEIAAEVDGPAVAAVAGVVAAVVDRAVVDGVVMVGLDTRKIGHGFSPIHVRKKGRDESRGLFVSVRI
jgi:hypothetical protein